MRYGSIAAPLCLSLSTGSSVNGVVARDAAVRMVTCGEGDIRCCEEGGWYTTIALLHEKLLVRQCICFLQV